MTCNVLMGTLNLTHSLTWSTLLLLKVTYDFLLRFHSNRGPISHIFRDRRQFQSIIANFPPPRVFWALLTGALVVPISAGATLHQVLLGLPSVWGR